MAKLRQSSFRRILVSRILILSVPVLLTGEFVAFKKARNSMLETAQKTLTESAVLKAEKITDTIATLKSNLNSASQTTVVRSGNPERIQAFINNLAVEQRKYIECIQVLDLQKSQPVASTCGDDAILTVENPAVIEDGEFSNGGVVNSGENPLVSLEEIQAQMVVPPKVVTNSLAGNDIPTQNKLQLLFSAPVYDLEGKLGYVFSIRVQLQQQLNQSSNFLTRYTAIIAEDGTILAHPVSKYVGKHIRKHADQQGLENLLKSAIARSPNRLHLFSEEEGQKFVAGYTTIANPLRINPNQSHQDQRQWIILDVISLDTALYGLQGIKLILIFLTLGLIAASVIASFYLARHVSHPLEKLCDYALQIGSTPQTQTKPYSFQIREFNQLARAFDLMTERLNAWAEEIETAWQDTKTANQLKSDFIATTSHEIRNPLNGIINCIQVVKDGLCDSREEELDYLNDANETAIHLLNIINGLLDLSKIEAGKLSVNLEVADLREIIKETINLQSLNIQIKGLQFNVPRLEQEMFVKVDRSKFKQVLFNIIGNATKFTDQGSITLMVETELIMEEEQEIYQAVIRIKDTGIGIEPTQQQQLFRPFVMVEDANNSRFKGTGLGLAISKNLMEMMGGKISLFSAGINQGTTVTITLPLLTSQTQNHETEIISGSASVDLSQPENLAKTSAFP